MNTLQRSILYSIILVLVMVVLQATGPSWRFKPQGIFLPQTNNNLPVQPAAKVQIYGAMPPHAQNLGYINVVMHFHQEPTRSVIAALKQKAQELVAQAGGNGFVILSSGYTEVGSVPMAQQIYMLHGVAIYQGKQ